MDVKYLIQCLHMSSIVVFFLADPDRRYVVFQYFLLSIYATLSITNIFTDLLFGDWLFLFCLSSTLCESEAEPTFPGQAESGVLLVVDLKQAVPQVSKIHEVPTSHHLFTTTILTGDKAGMRTRTRSCPSVWLYIQLWPQVKPSSAC